jgi:hypothetical protein
MLTVRREQSSTAPPAACRMHPARPPGHGLPCPVLPCLPCPACLVLHVLPCPAPAHLQHDVPKLRQELLALAVELPGVPGGRQVCHLNPKHINVGLQALNPRLTLCSCLIKPPDLGPFRLYLLCLHNKQSQAGGLGRHAGRRTRVLSEGQGGGEAGQGGLQT